jgi:hypothetical protein
LFCCRCRRRPTARAADGEGRRGARARRVPGPVRTRRPTQQTHKHTKAQTHKHTNAQTQTHETNRRRRFEKSMASETNAHTRTRTHTHVGRTQAARSKQTHKHTKTATNAQARGLRCAAAAAALTRAACPRASTDRPLPLHCTAQTMQQRQRCSNANHAMRSICAVQHQALIA